MAKSTSADDILAVARDADAVLVTYAKIPGELLRRSRAARPSAASASASTISTSRPQPSSGIMVTYVPDYCMHEVSDHAMALLLALARKIPFSNSWCSPAAGRCRRSCRSAG